MDPGLNEKIQCEICLILPICMNKVEFWENPTNKMENYTFVVNNELLEKCNYFKYMHKSHNLKLRVFFFEKKGLYVSQSKSKM
jgi:hypothetical protein